MAKIRGPQAVRAALLEAAADLLASEGDVSVRQVAARAGVNHGLVHHYFGGKDALIRATMEELSARQAARLTTCGDDDLGALSTLAWEAATEDPRFLNILTRALLDGRLPPELQGSFPVVARLVDAAERADLPNPATTVAAGLAFSLGLAVFGEWIADATGVCADDLDALRKQAFDTLSSTRPVP